MMGSTAILIHSLVSLSSEAAMVGSSFGKQTNAQLSILFEGRFYILI